MDCAYIGDLLDWRQLIGTCARVIRVHFSSSEVVSPSILAIPSIYYHDTFRYCLLHRALFDPWDLCFTF